MVKIGYIIAILSKKLIQSAGSTTDTYESATLTIYTSQKCASMVTPGVLATFKANGGMTLSPTGLIPPRYSRFMEETV